MSDIVQIQELKALIKEATVEAQRAQPEPEVRYYFPGYPFRKVTPQTYFRDTLAEVLTQSDALYILNDLVNGVPDE